MPFTEAELRLLARSDRVEDEPRSLSGHHNGRPPSGRVGMLTHNEILLMVAAGKRTTTIAAACRVTPDTISRWKRARGLQRKTKATR